MRIARRWLLGGLLLLTGVFVARAAIIGEVDWRETFEDYAVRINGTEHALPNQVAELHRAFSGSGFLHCLGGITQAHLVCTGKKTCNADTLIMHAHAFFKSDDPYVAIDKCERRGNPTADNCYFEPLRDGKPARKRYDIKPETLRMFTDCPVFKIGKDVALVRLEREVPAVTPYALIDTSIRGIKSFVGEKIAHQ